MASTSPDVATRITGAYKGIEGFYILNRNGDLGYFSTDGQRLIKETFLDGPPDSNNPELLEKVEAFFSELRDAATKFPPNKDKELGYLMPVGKETVWNTATLMLHAYVAKDLRDAFERAISRGQMTLTQGDRRAADMSPERGLHRGFEDLLNHIGSFGTYTFFPVLYFRSNDSSTEHVNHPLRVVNLLSLIPGTGRFTDLLARMRHNLQERGALTQASRVEHRFTLEGEDV